MLLRVCVSHGSTLEPKTTLTEEAGETKAAAEAGNSWGGMVWCVVYMWAICGGGKQGGTGMGRDKIDLS